MSACAKSSWLPPCRVSTISQTNEKVPQKRLYYRFCGIFCRFQKKHLWRLFAFYQSKIVLGYIFINEYTEKECHAADCIGTNFDSGFFYHAEYCRNDICTMLLPIKIFCDFSHFLWGQKSQNDFKWQAFPILFPTE